ncbi:hypothetical protein Lesp02_09920 [Lentzea sp. NBRC 105346]|uniref:DUF4129 domain-containing protein n=1 Tax=Lentzea sp. NBRC 105346 TaxID=3032205 RepID=UPI0024A252BC|nr:DUF4129 domain-containing protein [Lentzea sp. NBRC 105346]GLZ28802.1 hypothetical protein Lesp02_09920 [Lentzea sp. NBRC 105346]
MARSDVPVDIGPDEARDAAVRELADPIYAQARPGWLRQGLEWLLDRLNELLGAASGSGGIALLIVVLAIVLVVVIRLAGGRIGWAARSSGSVFGSTVLSAAEHRSAAEAAFASGDFAGAVRERFRALVRELEQRGVLDVRAGRTVDEVASDAGRELPALAGELRAAAVLFDDIWYGGRAASAESYQRVAAVDDRVRG